MMGLSIEVVERRTVAVKYLAVEAEARYAEDATVNGEPDDESAPRMPFLKGGVWSPVIELESGLIVDWPAGVVADIHYKVCDAGVYRLLDEIRSEVMMYDGYVPRMLCPGENGYGDYIIMKIDGSGQIEGWSADLSDFEQED